MELKDLTGQPGEWLRGTGPESDVIISTRIRLPLVLMESPKPVCHFQTGCFDTFQPTAAPVPSKYFYLGGLSFIHGLNY